MFRGLFQPLHLFIILIIALIVFGPSKLPRLGVGLGKGLRDFKRVLSQGKNQIPPGTGDQIKSTVKIVVTKLYYAFFFKR